MAIDRISGQFALDVQGLDKLKHAVGRDPQEGLKAAASQFEAMFIQMMLKSMRDALPESGLMSTDQSKFYDSLMDQQWSQTLAQRGIGIADQLTAQLSPSLKNAAD